MSKDTAFNISLALVFFAGVLSEHWWIGLPMAFAGIFWARAIAGIENEQVVRKSHNPQREQSDG